MQLPQAHYVARQLTQRLRTLISARDGYRHVRMYKRGRPRDSSSSSHLSISLSLCVSHACRMRVATTQPPAALLTYLSSLNRHTRGGFLFAKAVAWHRVMIQHKQPNQGPGLVTHTMSALLLRSQVPLRVTAAQPVSTHRGQSDELIHTSLLTR